MEPPPIQYAKTSDGVSIAYWVMGEGPATPVVWIELPSQLQLEQKLFPDQARAYELMSRAGILVRYDHRGFGLSDRGISSFPLDDLVKDLEAVVDKLALDRVVLLAASIQSSPVAAAYASAHPERVSKLVLGATAVSPPAHQQISSLLMVPGSSWQFVSEAMSRLAMGWDDEDASRGLAAWFRESSSYETFKAFWRDIAAWDVSDRLPMIQAPTLIGFAPEIKLATLAQVREMAGLIPNAQLVVAEGDSYEARTTAYANAVTAFIYGSGASRRTTSPSTLSSGTAVILFTDIVDSTALTERLGDAAFRGKARDLDATLRTIIREHTGAAIEGKVLGDGVMAVFTSAAQAIEAALACAKAGADGGLPQHLGIHAGDVIREENNVFGGAVNIAARISGLSAPGEVLVSRTVADLARTSAGVAFEDRGEQALKGIDEPVRVFAVREST